MTAKEIEIYDKLEMKISLAGKTAYYFRQYAKERNLTPQQLSQKLIEMIAEDNLCNAVLDDDAGKTRSTIATNKE